MSFKGRRINYVWNFAAASFAFLLLGIRITHTQPSEPEPFPLINTTSFEYDYDYQNPNPSGDDSGSQTKYTQALLRQNVGVFGQGVRIGNRHFNTHPCQVVYLGNPDWSTLHLSVSLENGLASTCLPGQQPQAAFAYIDGYNVPDSLSGITFTSGRGLWAALVSGSQQTAPPTSSPSVSSPQNPSTSSKDASGSGRRRLLETGLFSGIELSKGRETFKSAYNNLRGQALSALGQGELLPRPGGPLSVPVLVSSRQPGSVATASRYQKGQMVKLGRDSSGADPLRDTELLTDEAHVYWAPEEECLAALNNKFKQSTNQASCFVTQLVVYVYNPCINASLATLGPVNVTNSSTSTRRTNSSGGGAAALQQQVTQLLESSLEPQASNRSNASWGYTQVLVTYTPYDKCERRGVDMLADVSLQVEYFSAITFGWILIFLMLPSLHRLFVEFPFRVIVHGVRKLRGKDDTMKPMKPGLHSRKERSNWQLPRPVIAVLHPVLRLRKHLLYAVITVHSADGQMRWLQVSVISNVALCIAMAVYSPGLSPPLEHFVPPLALQIIRSSSSVAALQWFFDIVVFSSLMGTLGYLSMLANYNSPVNRYYRVQCLVSAFFMVLQDLLVLLQLISVLAQWPNLRPSWPYLPMVIFQLVNLVAANVLQGVIFSRRHDQANREVFEAFKAARRQARVEETESPASSEEGGEVIERSEGRPSGSRGSAGHHRHHGTTIAAPAGRQEGGGTQDEAAPLQKRKYRFAPSSRASSEDNSQQLQRDSQARRAATRPAGRERRQLMDLSAAGRGAADISGYDDDDVNASVGARRAPAGFGGGRREQQGQAQEAGRNKRQGGRRYQDDDTYTAIPESPVRQGLEKESPTASRNRRRLFDGPGPISEGREEGRGARGQGRSTAAAVRAAGAGSQTPGTRRLLSTSGSDEGDEGPGAPQPQPRNDLGAGRAHSSEPDTDMTGAPGPPSAEVDTEVDEFPRQHRRKGIGGVTDSDEHEFKVTLAKKRPYTQNKLYARQEPGTVQAQLAAVEARSKTKPVISKASNPGAQAHRPLAGKRPRPSATSTQFGAGFVKVWLRLPVTLARRVYRSLKETQDFRYPAWFLAALLVSGYMVIFQYGRALVWSNKIADCLVDPGVCATNNLGRYFRFVASILSPGQQLRLRNSLDLLMDTRETLVDGVASLLGVNATTGTAVPMNLTDTAVWRALSTAMSGSLETNSSDSFVADFLAKSLQEAGVGSVNDTAGLVAKMLPTVRAAFQNRLNDTVSSIATSASNNLTSSSLQTTAFRVLNSTMQEMYGAVNLTSSFITRGLNVQDEVRVWQTGLTSRLRWSSILGFTLGLLLGLSTLVQTAISFRKAIRKAHRLKRLRRVMQRLMASHSNLAAIPDSGLVLPGEEALVVTRARDTSLSLVVFFFGVLMSSAVIQLYMVGVLLSIALAILTHPWTWTFLLPNTWIYLVAIAAVIVLNKYVLIGYVGDAFLSDGDHIYRPAAWLAFTFIMSITNLVIGLLLAVYRIVLLLLTTVLSLGKLEVTIFTFFSYLDLPHNSFLAGLHMHEAMANFHDPIYLPGPRGAAHRRWRKLQETVRKLSAEELRLLVTLGRPKEVQDCVDHLVLDMQAAKALATGSLSVDSSNRPPVASGSRHGPGASRLGGTSGPGAAGARLQADITAEAQTGRGRGAFVQLARVTPGTADGGAGGSREGVVEGSSVRAGAVRGGGSAAHMGARYNGTRVRPGKYYEQERFGEVEDERRGVEQRWQGDEEQGQVGRFRADRSRRGSPRGRREEVTPSEGEY